MGKNRKGKKRQYSSEVISVRLPVDLLAWVDQQVDLFVKSNPGVYFTRNAFIRTVLHKAKLGLRLDE